jgi:hypothetical protein
MVHGERPQGPGDVGHSVQGNQLALGGANIEHGEGGGIQLILRQQLQDDHVLVGGGIDGGDLPRSIGAIEGVFYLLGGDPIG